MKSAGKPGNNKGGKNRDTKNLPRGGQKPTRSQKIIKPTVRGR